MPHSSGACARSRLDALAVRGIAAWKADVAAIWPEAAALLALVEQTAGQMQPAFYLHLPPDRPIAPRLALLGDAAHSTSPQLGQGANMGLLDALALADALAERAEIDDALRPMPPRAGGICAFTRPRAGGSRLSSSRTVEPRLLRDLAFPCLARIPYFRRETVRSLAGLKTGLLTSLEPEAVLAPAPAEQLSMN